LESRKEADLNFMEYVTGTVNDRSSKKRADQNIRQLIKLFSWKLKQPADLDDVREAAWEKVKAVYEANFGRMKCGASPTEAQVQEQLITCLVGFILTRIADSEQDKEKRRLEEKDLVDLLADLAGTLKGDQAATARWQSMYDGFKKAGIPQALGLAHYAGQFAKIADKSASLAGFDSDKLLNQYR
jgi:hypothetical protein